MTKLLDSNILIYAALGGFLGCKCDGEPGMQTFWLGLQRVRDFAEGMRFVQGVPMRTWVALVISDEISNGISDDERKNLYAWRRATGPPLRALDVNRLLAIGLSAMR
jgi:hypothetical protein